MSKLIRWETPFTDSSRPSVDLIVTTNHEATDFLKAIVAPQGIDKYPKYLVDFGRIVAFTCMEEAYAPERNFVSATIEKENLCAYEYLDSPWLKSYEAWIPFYTGSDTEPFRHFLIFGGDNNIEVITLNEPIIDIVQERKSLKIEYTI